MRYLFDLLNSSIKDSYSSNSTSDKFWRMTSLNVLFIFYKSYGLLSLFSFPEGKFTWIIHPSILISMVSPLSNIVPSIPYDSTKAQRKLAQRQLLLFFIFHGRILLPFPFPAFSPLNQFTPFLRMNAMPHFWQIACLILQFHSKFHFLIQSFLLFHSLNNAKNPFLFGSRKLGIHRFWWNR